MTTTKTEAWTLSDKRANYTLDNKESQLYIVEDNKDGDGSMDSVRRREQIICTLT
jgi:hypothetical protein